MQERVRDGAHSLAAPPVERPEPRPKVVCLDRDLRLLGQGLPIPGGDILSGVAVFVPVEPVADLVLDRRR